MPFGPEDHDDTDDIDNSDDGDSGSELDQFEQTIDNAIDDSGSPDPDEGD